MYCLCLLASLLLAEMAKNFKDFFFSFCSRNLIKIRIENIKVVQQHPTSALLYLYFLLIQEVQTLILSGQELAKNLSPRRIFATIYTIVVITIFCFLSSLTNSWVILQLAYWKEVLKNHLFQPWPEKQETTSCREWLVQSEQKESLSVIFCRFWNHIRRERNMKEFPKLSKSLHYLHLFH